MLFVYTRKDYSGLFLKLIYYVLTRGLYTDLLHWKIVPLLSIERCLLIGSQNSPNVEMKDRN